MYKTIVIDTNNLYYRNFEVNKNLTFTVNNSPMQTGGIYGSLKSIMGLKKKYLIEKHGKMIFTFDNHASKNNLRKQIDENYKCDRIEKSKKFYKGIDYLEKILMNMYDNSQIVRIPYMEADDLIPSILKEQDPHDKILLVSNDGDWCRNLTENIHQLKDGKIVTIYSFEEENGYFPNNKNVIFFKSFKGDKADNIPNPIPKFPKDILIKIIESKPDDIWDFFQKLNKGYYKDILPEDKHWYQKLLDKEIRKRLILNYRLVDFMGCEESDFREGTFNCKFNPNILKVMYNLFGFNIEKLDSRLSQAIKIPTHFNFT